MQRTKSKPKGLKVQPNQIFAIGYSTYSSEDFVNLLKAHDIKMVKERSLHRPRTKGRTGQAAS